VYVGIGEEELIVQFDMADIPVTIKRKPRDWSLIPNSLLQDSKLSFGARGMFCYLLSLYKSRLGSVNAVLGDQKVTDGVIERYLNELEKHKYIERSHIKQDDGKYTLEISLIEDPYDMGNIKPEKVYAPREKKVEKGILNSKQREVFERFWKGFPYRIQNNGTKTKGSKIEAERAFALHVPENMWEAFVTSAYNYAKSGLIPRDAHRYIGSGYWMDFAGGITVAQKEEIEEYAKNTGALQLNGGRKKPQSKGSDHANAFLKLLRTDTAGGLRSGHGNQRIDGPDSSG
jgi:hypothetical protein